MKPSRGLVRLIPQLHPPIVEHDGVDLSAIHVNADVNTAEQLSGADATGPAHAAGVNGHAESYGLAGKAAESGGVKVEAGGGGRRVGW